MVNKRGKNMATQSPIETDKLILEARKRLSMGGVESVDNFSPQGLKLTVSGGKIVVGGDGIKIIAFDKATGNLTAEGTFTEIKYFDKSQSLIKRIFK